jgi:FlaA1/EpsC-like NDP-sugar epimerase
MASLGLNDKLLAQVAQLAKLPTVKAGAAALVVLGLLPRLSSVLTRRKVNNYLADKTWNWNKEIVVVTGGSSGIGAELVTKLAKRGVKVIIVDMNEPQGKLGMSVMLQCSSGPR